MKQKVNKTEFSKSLKNIDWKSFFNMRIFRYTFLRQLKWSTAYFYFIIAIIWNIIYLALSFSSVEQIVKITNDLETYSFTILFYMFVLFIFYKSLEVFREEIDDGTLLIINSMPHSRSKLAIQKWLSLQVICLFFVLIVVLLSPIISLMINGFKPFAWEGFTFTYKNSWWLIARLVIIQILASSVALLVSLYFGQKATLICAALFIGSIVGLNYLLEHLFPDSFKAFDGVAIHIGYLLIGLSLLGLLIFTLHKKDFA